MIKHKKGNLKIKGNAPELKADLSCIAYGMREIFTRDTIIDAIERGLDKYEEEQMEAELEEGEFDIPDEVLAMIISVIANAEKLKDEQEQEAADD